MLLGTIERQQGACTVAQAASWRDDRDTVVAAVDHLVSSDVLAPLRDVIHTSVLPLVDEGRLPELALTLADLGDALVDDTSDPERHTLDALLQLKQTRTVLQTDHVLDLLRGLLAAPEAKAWLHALNHFAARDDGSRPVAVSALELASSLLDEVAGNTECRGLDLGDWEHTLLRQHDASAWATVTPSAPAWAVRPDGHVNPRVAIDARTGTVYKPFVDADRDGSADINAHGDPIDPWGRALDLPPFSRDPDRDAFGRKLSGDGTPVYAYFDATHTSFATLLRWMGDAIAAGVPYDAARAIDATLGPQRRCAGVDLGAGATDCLSYGERDNAAADFVFLFLEMLRYDDVGALLRSIHSLAETHPDTAEKLFVAFGQLLESIQRSDVSVSDPQLLALVAEALPLLADVLAVDNSAATSTPRLLMQVFHDLGQQARDFPDELYQTLIYRTVHKEVACTDSKIDAPRSSLVDYSQPRWIHTAGAPPQDNRSALEQSIELLAAADCGTVPFTGKTVAELMIDLMADMRADTVCSLVDVSLGLLNLLPNVSAFVGATALDLIGCDGDAVWADLNALDALAQSGALDTYLPLAQVFVEKQQVRTLLDIFHLIAADLRRDDDTDAATRSRVRKLLPVIARALHAGAADSLLDLDALLVTVPAPQTSTSSTAADLVVDAMAHFVDDRGAVLTRAGPVEHTSLAEQLLASLQTMARAIDATPAAQARLNNLIDYAAGYFTRTRVDQRGTADPSDDALHLSDGRVVPLLQDALGLFVDVFELPASERACYLDHLQSLADTFMTGPQLATLVRLLAMLEEFQERDTLESMLLALLRPDDMATAKQQHVPLLKSLAGLAQSSVDGPPVRRVLRFLARASRPEQLDGASLIDTFDRLLREDTHDTVLGIIRNGFSADDAALEEPLLALIEALARVADRRPEHACAPTDVAWSPQDLGEIVSSITGFIRDETYGLGGLFELIGMRSN